MPGKTKKATFNLHSEVLAEMDTAVSRGMASSKNALVEQAIIKELKELRKKERKALWQQAAKDPLFIRDVQQVESDFRYADSETAKKIDR